MPSTAIVSPLLPGKAADARRLAADLLVARRAESDAFQQRLGITRETWYVQPVPGGELLVLVIEADDLERAFRGLAEASDPFGQWFKQEMAALTGASFDQPPPSLPASIFEWRAP